MNRYTTNLTTGERRELPGTDDRVFPPRPVEWQLGSEEVGPETLWTPRCKLVISKPLQTPARTRSRYGGEWEYPVSLKMYDGTAGRMNACVFKGDTEEARWDEFRREHAYQWVLVIEGTPGHWYLQTFIRAMAHAPLRDVIDIDTSSGWQCINFAQILAEAKRLM